MTLCCLSLMCCINIHKERPHIKVSYQLRKKNPSYSHELYLIYVRVWSIMIVYKFNKFYFNYFSSQMYCNLLIDQRDCLLLFVIWMETEMVENQLFCSPPPFFNSVNFVIFIVSLKLSKMLGCLSIIKKKKGYDLCESRLIFFFYLQEKLHMINL